jgi:DNA-binding beta-propeller fold protein YncE
VPAAAEHRALTPGPGLPNSDRPASELHARISPFMGTIPLNQPASVNGALFLAGNAVHQIWDVSNPLAPAMMSELSSPHKNGEAESHQVSFAQFEDGSLHAVTISGRGIDLWNISDPSAPVLESALELHGIDYGDFTEAVWGVFWQGHHIFVGGTNTGLHVIDATDPTVPRVIRRLGNTSLGSVSAGPLFALGNLLVVTTPKENGGIATVDIGDPEDPLLLDSLLAPESYIGGFFGIHAHLLSPFRSYDVITDPTNIRLVGSTETPATEYMSFADSHALVGSLRTIAGGVTGILEYDLSDLDAVQEVSHVEGRDRRSDDQFSLALGNLLVVADDERGYGAYLAVRNTARDTSGPAVIAVNPPDGAVGQPLSTRIGVSFSDLIELTSVGPASFELKNESTGAAVSGRFGLAGTVLAFSPSAPLEPDTRYTLRIPAGGITDLVGNAIAEEHLLSFGTGAANAGSLPCEIIPPAPVTVGATALLSANNTNEASYQYSWTFGDGALSVGASTSHIYTEPSRHSVSLTVLERPTETSRYDLYEAEGETLTGGVFSRTENAGFSGEGYADFPLLTQNDTEVLFSAVHAVRSGAHDVVIRYANGDTTVRRLLLVVNGQVASTVDFPGMGDWAVWSSVRVPVALSGGMNSIALRADRGVAGPNVDRLDVSVARASTCSVTQIVHRPIPSGPAAAKSGTVVIAEGRAWVVNPDHGTVSAVSLGSRQKEREIEVGGKPRGLARAPDGTIWVAVEEDDTLAIIDGTNVEKIALPAGARPYGVAFSPDESRAYLTLEGPGRLAIFDSGSRQLMKTVELGAGVRGVAVSHDSQRVFVTRFISKEHEAEIYELDENGERVRTIVLGESHLLDTPDQGRGVPNYLNQLAINPDGTEAWIPSKQDNTLRGALRDGEALTHDATIRPIVSRIDLRTNHETIEQRMDLNDACMPFAVEHSPLGDLVFIAVQGSNKVEVRETYSGRIAGSFSVGHAPEGLVLEGNLVFVQSFLDRTLTIADVGAFLRGTDNVAEILATVPLTEREVLSPEILAGKKLFYDASDPRMSNEGYISCASCHLDGRDDGRVWDFGDRGEGLRNTISLEGRAGLGHGMVHWSANFDEIQDFENDIRDAFGGKGLMSDEQFRTGTRSDALGDKKAGVSAELDALAAYVTSLSTFPKSPYRAADGALTAEAMRGKTVFVEHECAGCHVPPLYTDRMTHDVGTIRASSGMRRGEALAGIDTPTLIGAFATPPYLHDGSVAAFDALFDNPAHVGDAAFSASDKSALIAFLMQLDRPEELPDVDPEPMMPIDPEPMSPNEEMPGTAVPDKEGCACSATQESSGFFTFFILLGACLILHKRSRV